MQLEVSQADKGEVGLRWDELDSDLAATPLEILRKITAKKSTYRYLVYFIFTSLNVKPLQPRQCDPYLGLKIATMSYEIYIYYDYF